MGKTYHIRNVNRNRRHIRNPNPRKSTNGAHRRKLKRITW